MQLEWDKELLIGGEPITSSGRAYMWSNGDGVPTISMLRSIRDV